MADSLREDIRKYERENNTDSHCGAANIRCLSCPLSFLGCPVARRMLASRTTKDLKDNLSLETDLTVTEGKLGQEGLVCQRAKRPKGPTTRVLGGVPPSGLPHFLRK